MAATPTSQTIGLYGYVFVVPLGFLGHLCSLLTFSSKTLRRPSSALLFVFLTISDLLYQLINIYDFINQVLQLPIIRSAYLCRFRTFILNFSTVTSAWILVLISLDRFIRARLPYYQAQLRTPKTICLSAMIVCILSIAFTSHVLQFEFAFIFPTTSLCGPARFPPTSYSDFYYEIWPILQLLITYFIPNCLMIIFLIGIYSKIRTQRTRIRISTRNEKLQQQMFILMLSSILCFAICTLPSSIHRIIFLRSEASSATLMQIAILTIFLNINYSYNFYIHCLTSKLFRKEFIKRMKKLFLCCKRQQRIIYPVAIINRPAI